MPPELADVLLAKLEHVQASDFGIGPDICQQLPPSAAVGYIEVGQTREVTLCVFVLKKGASLPLHDHPGMHDSAVKVVASRLLSMPPSQHS